jgi:3-hydroxymyristoyl/3-hydroxydecanoyl-(acyl carrier protein) dehydratase
MEFAIGSIGRALGERFAHVDGHPTRVRLPDEPLMLVDRVTEIEAEPQSMTSGRIVTEHDVLTDGWYLDGGRMPTCIAVEAGQADLLLSGFLGIDSETQGLAVYRLLDAVVTFYSELPTPEQVVQYDIRILEFFRQGDTWLFRFQFDSTVNGRPLLTMREGTAGFFTQSYLDAGKGIIRSGIDQQAQAGSRPDDRRDLVPMREETFDEDRLEALRAGDLVSAFGEDFKDLHITRPLTIPGERMRLVHRVTELDPEGGRYGIGSIVAEADIHPDDWFLTCHFSDDQVMPGTLMYECCLHTLRIFLLRMGWIASADGAAWQPVVDVQSRLKCRGQVLASTKKVTYEIHLRELGYLPEPYAIADALMYADGKPIVEIRDMSVRLTGTDRQRIEEMWEHRTRGLEAGPIPYGKNSILAFSSGKPSEAFGAPYGVFDEGERRIARLPRPPYQFLDRDRKSVV